MSIVNEEGLDVKKKHIVIAMMAFIILLSVAYLQWGRKERVVNSFSTASDTSYTQEFSVIANTLFLNKNEYAKDLIAKTLHNGFQNIRFSYDVGFPDQITIYVYKNRSLYHHGRENFRVIYSQEGNYKIEE